MAIRSIAEAVLIMKQKKVSLNSSDEAFVTHFAYNTEDMELTEKLIDELNEEGADKEKIYQKYNALINTNRGPAWIRCLEDIYASMELYKMMQEKIIELMEEVGKAYGIEVSLEELKRVPCGKVKEYILDKANKR